MKTGCPFPNLFFNTVIGQFGNLAILQFGNLIVWGMVDIF